MVARLVVRGTLGSTLVLLGGLVTATLPRSTPLLHAGQPSEVLLLLRGTTPGRMAGLALVLVGLGAPGDVLAGALPDRWRSAVTTPAASSRPDRDPGVVRAAPPRAAAVLAGRLVLRGPGDARQPRTSRPTPTARTCWRGRCARRSTPCGCRTPAPYGPLPLAFGGVAADLTASPWLLVIAHRGLALVGLVLLAWAVPRLAAWSGVNPALASALVLASPFMLANGVAGLHNDLLMVGLMAAALVVAAERGWVWGAALAGLAAAVKAPGGLVCLGIVLVSLPVGRAARRPGSAAPEPSAAVSVGVLVGLGVVTGLGIGWLGGLSRPGQPSARRSRSPPWSAPASPRLTGAELVPRPDPARRQPRRRSDSAGGC